VSSKNKELEETIIIQDALIKKQDQRIKALVSQIEEMISAIQSTCDLLEDDAPRTAHGVIKKALELKK
jgi:hypothetical protein